MIRLVIKYPHSENARFDFDYYTGTHMPLSRRLLGDFGMGDFEVLRCKQSPTGEEPAFVCITQIEFASLEEMQAGMAAHGEELKADFAMYTNITPVATVCEPLPRD